MSNTVTTGKNTVTVVFDGSTAFDLCNTLGMTTGGVRLSSIMFYPNAADDVAIVRDGSATGTIIWKFKDVAGSGGQAIFEGGKDCMPYVKGTEGVASAMMIFHIL